MFLKIKSVPGVYRETEVAQHKSVPKEITQDFYYNLDLVRSIHFGKVKDGSFNGDVWDDFADCNYITFSGITVDYHAPVHLTLIFNEYGMGEYHRTIRVIEGDKA